MCVPLCMYFCVCMFVVIVESAYTADFESYVVLCKAFLYSRKPNCLARRHEEFSLCWIFLWVILLPSSHVLLMNLKILGLGFSRLSWLLSFKVAQKRKGEGQVNLMKRGGKLRQEWPKFSNVKVQCRTSEFSGCVVCGCQESLGVMNEKLRLND